jgi:hypothetical protein
MKRIYNIKFIAFLGILGLFSACDKELDKENPNNVIVKSFYAKTGDVTSAVNAVYAVLQDPQLISREWFFTNDLRSDDMASGGGQLETPRYQLLIGTNDASNAVATSFWQGLYGVVHRANAVIEFGPNAVTTSDKDKALLNSRIAEAKYLRAWAYFELASIWGQVPLYDVTVKTVDGTKPLAPIADIYASIEANLNDAIGILPIVQDDAGRITRGAARGLLAKVYMQQNKYAEAKTQLDSIINSPLNPYKLVNNFNDNFMEETEYNAEAVFEVGFIDQNGNYGWGYNQGNVQGQETTIHNQEINPLTWGNLIPSLKLVEEFEAGDPRYKFTFYEVGDSYAGGVLQQKNFNIASTTTGGVTKKVGWRKHTILYKNTQDYYPSGNNERVMRYAEILLMMAECVNETGGSQADVLKYLNPTRARASVNMPLYGTPAMDAQYPVDTKENRFKAIVHEKRVELAGEEIRNKDILRWRDQGKIALIGGEPISYYNENYRWLPIPQYEKDNNPSIK